MLAAGGDSDGVPSQPVARLARRGSWPPPRDGAADIARRAENAGVVLAAAAIPTASPFARPPPRRRRSCRSRRGRDPGSARTGCEGDEAQDEGPEGGDRAEHTGYPVGMRARPLALRYVCELGDGPSRSLADPRTIGFISIDAP